MRERGLQRTGAVACAVALGVLVVVLGLLVVLSFGGEAGGGSPPSAIALSDGVPVGVQHSRAGALAAADNYLAIASESIEQDPAVFAALVGQAYAPEIRGATLAQAERIRAGDTQNMANYRQGGRAIALIAARRLNSYTTQTATVTSWLGGFVWGPELSPRQSWNLAETTLRWQAGRWLVVSCNTDRTPAPVPSIVYVNGPNDRAPAFGRLAGMSAPFYGTGG